MFLLGLRALANAPRDVAFFSEQVQFRQEEESRACVRARRGGCDGEA